MSPRQGQVGVEEPAAVIDVIVEAVTRRDFTRLVGLSPGLVSVAPAWPSAGVTTGDPARWSWYGAQGGTGGTLVVARFSDADSLDPHHTLSGHSSQIMTNIFDTLVALNPTMEIEGALAERWEISADGLEYAFFLRSGIVFHDGTPFNAEAVKFTFDRLMDPATAAPAATWVSKLRETVLVDASTVKLVLNEPFSPLLGLLARAFFGIVSPAAVQERGDEFARRPVGTGPWKLEEWVAGERITLVPHEQYVGTRSFVTNHGGPLVERLTFRTIPEGETQLAAFETGEVNVFWPLPRELSRLREDPDAQVLVASNSNDVWYIEFSMIAPQPGSYGVQFKPPFDDPLVRQAVACGINIDEIIEKVLEGLALRNHGPMPTGAWAYTPDIEHFASQVDPERAKALLEQAGWVDVDGDGVREKDGAKLDVLFWAWTEGANEKVAQVVQNQLNAVGFNVATEMVEIGTMLVRLPENVSDFNLMAYGGYPEPDVVRLMTTRSWGFGRYQDQHYQELVTQALKTTDRAERTALYFEAAQKALADTALVPLWSSLKATAVRADVKNYKLDPANPDWGVYDDVYVEE